MKLLNLTLFSLLMGITIAVQAGTELDREYAKCIKAEEEIAAYEERFKQLEDEYYNSSGDAHDEAGIAKHDFWTRSLSANKKNQAIKAHCQQNSIIWKKEREEQGLGAQ